MSYFTAPFRLVSHFFPTPEGSQSQQSQMKPGALSSESANYNPSPSDTVLVRSFLVKLGLPIEIALQIVDFANYFPQIRGYRKESLSFPASRGRNNSATALYVVTDPIPLGGHGEKIKIQSVRFRIRSHDQGWGGDYGCQGKYTLKSDIYLRTSCGKKLSIIIQVHIRAHGPGLKPASSVLLKGIPRPIPLYSNATYSTATR